MNLSLVGRQFELTDPIKDYIAEAVDSLKKYNLDIISTKVIVSADERNGKKGFNVEFTIHLPNKNTVVIKQKDKDVYAAIDLAIERAKKVLRRHHDKIKDKKHVKPEGAQEALSNESLSDVDEIIPMELELYKPLDIEEALAILKSDNRQFLVFVDLDGKTRVLYKRGDNKYGLY